MDLMFARDFTLLALSGVVLLTTFVRMALD